MVVVVVVVASAAAAGGRVVVVISLFTAYELTISANDDARR